MFDWFKRDPFIEQAKLDRKSATLPECHRGLMDCVILCTKRTCGVSDITDEFVRARAELLRSGEPINERGVPDGILPLIPRIEDIHE